MLDNDQAELAPKLDDDKRTMVSPDISCAPHPQKPDEIRVVFDSSAEFEGISLNDVLLRGPDLNTPLLGVLIRFSKEPISFMADVQQTFYCFTVEESHRDFLRFLWYTNNSMERDVREYRMKVHVLGNSP